MPMAESWILIVVVGCVFEWYLLLLCSLGVEVGSFQFQFLLCSGRKREVAGFEQDCLSNELQQWQLLVCLCVSEVYWKLLLAPGSLEHNIKDMYYYRLLAIYHELSFR